MNFPRQFDIAVLVRLYSFQLQLSNISSPGAHISVVLRWEEKKLTYMALKKEWDREKMFQMKVTGVTEYTLARDNKKFLALQVKLFGLAKVRSNLDLPAEEPSQTTHITIGEKFM